MKVCRRLVLSFIAALLLFPLSNASASTFSDVKNYQDEIKYLTNQGILTGYPDGTFKPERNMTRLNGVQVLLRAKGITNFDAPDPNFTDMTPDSHGYAEVAKAVELGIISGKTNPDGSKRFDPTGILTRGQMAKIIVETMGYPIDNSFTFRDVPTSNGFRSYISTLAAQRITEGYEDLTFKPNLAVSRQHFSVFVARMLDDKFKPAPRQTSYLLDKTMIYLREVSYDGNKNIEELRYIRPYGSFDLWHATVSGETLDFVVSEDKNYLRTGFPESSLYIDLSYPLYKGKVFSDGWDHYWTVVNKGLTIKTRAGTFTQVIEVKDNDGFTVYYAPNVGAIKSVSKGRTVMEVIKLTPR